MAKQEKKVRIFSALEVANICGVVNQTAINWIKNGYLKAFMTPGGQYRVYADDLVAFLDTRGMRIPDELQALIDEQPEWGVVLIVDDDVEVNNLLKSYVKRKFPNIEIIQAFDGFDAGMKIAERRPGLVMLDIDLPGINGHELCKRIKADSSLGSPFIIVMTGLADPEEKARALQEGADQFIAKPFDMEDVINSLQDLYKKMEG